MSDEGERHGEIETFAAHPAVGWLNRNFYAGQVFYV